MLLPQHKNKLILCFVLLCTWLYPQFNPSVYGKNLVPNGGFENYRKKTSNIRQAVPWNQIASADYYHSPVEKDTTAEKGAYEGDSYAGLRYQKRYKEFLQVRLTESLHRGSLYEYTMYVRLAYWSNAALKSLGVLITKGGYKGQASAVKSSIIDSVCKKSAFVNGYRWFKIHGYYKADGGEKYLTIGNFHPDIKKDMSRKDMRNKLGFREAYYFIDNVSLVRVMQPDEYVETVIVGPNKTNFEEDSVLAVNADVKIGDKIALKNIFFSPGSFYVLAESNQELNKLAQYLLRNPSLVIQINGHSDNTGLKYKNQKMSEQRAREVFEYLIRKGVQNKMYFKGYGSTQPIASNETDDGKAKNRRVEFEIIKK